MVRLLVMDRLVVTLTAISVWRSESAVSDHVTPSISAQKYVAETDLDLLG